MCMVLHNKLITFELEHRFPVSQLKCMIRKFSKNPICSAHNFSSHSSARPCFAPPKRCVIYSDTEMPFNTTHSLLSKHKFARLFGARCMCSFGPYQKPLRCCMLLHPSIQPAAQSVESAALFANLCPMCHPTPANRPLQVFRASFVWNVVHYPQKSVRPSPVDARITK